MKNALTLILLTLVLFGAGYGQQINAIQTRCPAPYKAYYSSVRATASGALTYAPCPNGASHLFTVNPIGGVFGINFSGNDSIFQLWFTALSGGIFKVGTALDNLQVDAGNGETSVAASNAIYLGAPVIDLSGQTGNLKLNRTITPIGTTGNATINKPAGTVNVAAGTNQVIISNTLVDDDSIVLATARMNDATCSVKSAIVGAGEVVILMTANCTATTSVGFLVTN